MLTGELDPLVDEGEAYAARLEAAGVPTTVQRAPGMVHGFFSVPVPSAIAARAQATAALRDALQP